jgi:hypothetical protein
MTCSRARLRYIATHISRTPCQLRPRLPLGAIPACLALEGRRKHHCLRRHHRQCLSRGCCHSRLFLFCQCPAQAPRYRLRRHHAQYVFPLFSCAAVLSLSFDGGWAHLLSIFILTLPIGNSHLPLILPARACATRSQLVQHTRAPQAQPRCPAVRVT